MGELAVFFFGFGCFNLHYATLLLKCFYAEDVSIRNEDSFYRIEFEMRQPLQSLCVAKHYILAHIFHLCIIGLLIHGTINSLLFTRKAYVHLVPFHLAIFETNLSQLIPLTCRFFAREINFNSKRRGAMERTKKMKSTHLKRANWINLFTSTGRSLIQICFLHGNFLITDVTLPIFHFKSPTLTFFWNKMAHSCCCRWWWRRWWWWWGWCWG